MFTDLRLELILSEERKEIFTNACELILLVVFCVLEGLKLRHELDQPVFDYVQPHILQVCPDLEVLAPEKGN